MTGRARLPLVARLLLRLSPVPREDRGAVETDLLELFDARRRERGAAHAHWRLYRDAASLWRLPLLGDARIDLKHAIRLFMRQPAILLLTIAGLSLGLGIATATFSIMNAAVLRGEGLADPGRAPLVLRATDRSTATAWTYDEFLRLREGATRMQVEGVVSDAAAVSVARTPEENPAPAGVAFVSGGFFTAAGGRAAFGRPLGEADEKSQASGPPPAVVSFVFWTAKLNRDPDAVGRTIRVGRSEAVIIGVAPRGFAVPGNRMLWMPLSAYGAVYGSPSGTRPPGVIEVFGRLLPDASLADAEAQLSGVAATLPGSGIPGDSALRVRLDPDEGLGRISTPDTLAITLFVSIAIGLVLLLVCANVATVLVSTAITREREMGVRAALGASRSRIVRQLVTESLLLGGIAAIAGLMLTSWAVPLIGRMIEAPAGADLAPDLTVYAFLGLVTIITGVVAGLAPARHSRGVDLVTPLKGAGAGSNRAAPRRLRSILVMAQAAASVMLIVTASLFVRASVRAAAIDVGFDATGLYAVSAGFGYGADVDGARARELWARAIPDVQRLPGIRSVALAEIAPFSGVTTTSITRGEPARTVYLNRTRPEYFETVGLRVLAGRSYTREEIASKAPVALVSESLARAYWRGSPLGQMLPREIPVPGSQPVIIGVVADAISARLHRRETLALYTPLDPPGEIFAQLLIRVAPGADGVTQQAMQRLRTIDPRADIRIASVEEAVDGEARQPRTAATLTGIVGAVAVLLCVIGLYGLTASLAGQRTREMGIRTALGAAPGDLLRLLMWDSLRPVVLGLALGAGAALLAGRMVVAAMFFGVSPYDPLAFAGAVAVLLAASAAAVIVPTRRASAVDAALVLKRG